LVPLLAWLGCRAIVCYRGNNYGLCGSDQGHAADGTVIFDLLCSPEIGIHLPPMIAGWVAYSINSGAYVSEVVRAGIQSIERGQMEAATVPGYVLVAGYALCGAAAGFPEHYAAAGQRIYYAT
jgi:hypothetical protein